MKIASKKSKRFGKYADIWSSNTLPSDSAYAYLTFSPIGYIYSEWTGYKTHTLSIRKI